MRGAGPPPLPALRMSRPELRAVYYPDEDTFLLVDAVLAGEGGRRPRRVLELGVGAGAVLAAVSCRLGPAEAVGVDMNPTACVVAQRTLEEALREMPVGSRPRVSVLCGSLFSPLAPEDTFDLILFNPPYVPSECSSLGTGEAAPQGLDMALDGGAGGREVIDAFLDGLPRRLERGCPEAACYMVCIEANDVRGICVKCRTLGLRAEVVASKRLSSEHLHVLRIVWDSEAT